MDSALSRQEATLKLADLIRDGQHYVVMNLPIDVPTEVGECFLGWDGFFDVGSDSVYFSEGASDEYAVCVAWALANTIMPTALVLVAAKSPRTNAQVKAMQLLLSLPESDSDLIVFTEEGLNLLAPLSFDAVELVAPGTFVLP